MPNDRTTDFPGGIENERGLFLNLLKKEPQNTHILNNLGAVCRGGGQYQESEKGVFHYNILHLQESEEMAPQERSAGHPRGILVSFLHFLLKNPEIPLQVGG